MCVTHASGRTPQAESAAKEKMLTALFQQVRVWEPTVTAQQPARGGVSPYSSRCRRLFGYPPVTHDSARTVLLPDPAVRSLTADSRDRRDRSAAQGELLIRLWSAEFMIRFKSRDEIQNPAPLLLRLSDGFQTAKKTQAGTRDSMALVLYVARVPHRSADGCYSLAEQCFTYTLA